MKRITIIILMIIFTNILYANTRLLRINYKIALKYYKSGNYTKSTVHLIDALKNPSINKRVTMRSKVYLLLARSYNLLGHYNNAEYYLYQLFRNTPINRYYKEGLLEIGKTYILSKNYDKSIQVYNYIIQKFNDRNFVSEALFLKGEAYLLKNDIAETINQFEIIINNYKNTKRYQDAKLRLMQLGYLKKPGSNKTNIKERFKNVNKTNKIPIKNIENGSLTKEEREALARAEEAKQKEKDEFAKLKKQRQKEIERLKKERQQAIEKLKKEKNAVIKKLREQRLAELEKLKKIRQLSEQEKQKLKELKEQQQKDKEKNKTENKPDTVKNTGSDNKPDKTPKEPVIKENTKPVIPDISFPSDRTYYPSDSGFARKLRYDLLKGIKNLSEKDLMKLESRLRLLEKRERELTRLRKELFAFHKLLLTKDRVLSLKKRTLKELSKKLKNKEERLLLLMNLKKKLKNIETNIKKDGK